MGRHTKLILSGILFVSGAYIVYKYTPLPSWIKKNIFGEKQPLSGSAAKFPLTVGSRQIPEVGVVQLSLQTPLTGILNADADMSALSAKYSEPMQAVSGDFYNTNFKQNEDTFKTQLDEFYKAFVLTA